MSAEVANSRLKSYETIWKTSYNRKGDYCKKPFKATTIGCQCRLMGRISYLSNNHRCSHHNAFHRTNPCSCLTLRPFPSRSKPSRRASQDIFLPQGPRRQKCRRLTLVSKTWQIVDCVEQTTIYRTSHPMTGGHILILLSNHLLLIFMPSPSPT